MRVYLLTSYLIDKLVKGGICSSGGVLRSRWKEELVADTAHKGNDLDTIALAKDFLCN